MGKKKPDTIRKDNSSKRTIHAAFNHLFITLPSPDQEIVNHINNTLFNFLWSNNVKIKRNVIIKQYWEGSLKMMNLAAFIEALKITWIRRLLKSDSNKKIRALENMVKRWEKKKPDTIGKDNSNNWYYSCCFQSLIYHFTQPRSKNS